MHQIQEKVQIHGKQLSWHTKKWFVSQWIREETGRMTSLNQTQLQSWFWVNAIKRFRTYSQEKMRCWALLKGVGCGCCSHIPALRGLSGYTTRTLWDKVQSQPSYPLCGHFHLTFHTLSLFPALYAQWVLYFPQQRGSYSKEDLGLHDSPWKACVIFKRTCVIVRTSQNISQSNFVLRNKNNHKREKAQCLYSL